MQSPEDYARAIRAALDAYHAGTLSYVQVFELTSALWRNVLARGLTDQVSNALADAEPARAVVKTG